MISVIIGLLSFILTKAILPACVMLGENIGLVDAPGKTRKIHKIKTPVIGGFTIGVVVLVVGGICAGMGILDNSLAFILGPFYLLFLILGIFDDRFDISAKYKFVIQCLVAFCIVYSGIYFSTLDDVFGITLPEWILQLVTMVFIVGTVNAYNLVDGIDGLLGSFFILAFAFLGVVSYSLGMIGLFNLLVLFFGSIGAFLIQNFKRKNKIFMGDSGALSIGFVVAVVSIYLFETGYEASGELSWIHVGAFGVVVFPAFDTIFVFVKRLFNKGSVFKADNTHFHHLVIQIWPKHFQATLFIIACAVVTFCTGLLLFSAGYTVLSFVSMPLMFLIVRGAVFQLHSIRMGKQVFQQVGSY